MSLCLFLLLFIVYTVRHSVTQIEILRHVISLSSGLFIGVPRESQNGVGNGAGSLGSQPKLLYQTKSHRN